ncbi:hypothetical protein LZG73_01080 [Dyadobacter sp. CY326]|nr:hypothetical protein [Dyadobacter sp. CY326]
MSGYIETKMIRIDPITNGYTLESNDREIMANPNKYYRNLETVFYKRTGYKIDTVQRITSKHLYLLHEIKRILDKNQTRYKIVLSPLYEQVKFNPGDLSILKSIFGKNLYDFSGKNPLSEPKTNFYEDSHFRPHVGEIILNSIYKPAKPDNFTNYQALRLK